MAHGYLFIQDLAVILAVAAVVGWICQRLGLSVVVGFLAAGMVVGPYTPPATLVSDIGRIETLAQVGLVFLMFSIGLKLSLRKLRRLGLGLMAATFCGALIVYYLARILGLAVGWDATASLFLAGMLMVSSSAIIAKILQETGRGHERSGQLAMGISVLEDVVAVVMLTLLTSVVEFGRGGGAGVAGTLFHLGAFVVLAGVGGLLLVPWLLRRMSISANEELQTLGVAALLFGLAVVAQAAGYSLALGAFLLGTIVAETLHRNQVERTFEGMRDIFTAVFFVAIGLQIDVQRLGSSVGLILGLSLFTLLARSFAVSAGLLLVGTPFAVAVRTGLTTTPIGEFSFIIAQLGVAAKAVPESFYPLAVGVSLVTALAGPLLTRHSAALSEGIAARQPRWLADGLRIYHEWLERLRRRRERNLLWQLSRKRILQVGVGSLFVTGVIIFSGQLFQVARGWLPEERLFPRAPEVLFWSVLGLAILAPLLAIWRNISAMALLYSEVATRGMARAAVLRPVVETGLKGAAGLGMFVWLVVVMPLEGTARWLLLLAAAVTAGALLLLRRRLIYWHSELEVELLSAIDAGQARMTATSAPWLQPHGEWNLQMVECTLPDLADCQGQPIAQLQLRSRFGCSVVGIERQGFMIPLPPPEAVLYPRDKVLLLGTGPQLEAGRRFLGAVSGLPGADSVFDEVRMEAMEVPGRSPAVGRSLLELSPAQRFGVQVAGVRRGSRRLLNPAGEERLAAGDDLLVLGPPVPIREFKDWLREPVDDPVAGGVK